MNDLAALVIGDEPKKMSKKDKYDDYKMMCEDCLESAYEAVKGDLPSDFKRSMKSAISYAMKMEKNEEKEDY